MKETKNLRHIFLMILTTTFFCMPLWAQNSKLKADDKSNAFTKKINPLERIIPDLSDEQKNAIQALHIEFLKETLPLKNQIRERQARLKTLETSANVDVKLINNEINEIGSLRTEIRKKKSLKHQEIRKLLDDDQRILFDTHYVSEKKNKKPRNKNKRNRKPKQ